MAIQRGRKIALWAATDEERAMLQDFVADLERRQPEVAEQVRRAIANGERLELEVAIVSLEEGEDEEQAMARAMAELNGLADGKVVISGCWKLDA